MGRRKGRNRLKLRIDFLRRSEQGLRPSLASFGFRTTDWEAKSQHLGQLVANELLKRVWYCTASPPRIRAAFPPSDPGTPDSSQSLVYAINRDRGWSGTTFPCYVNEFAEWIHAGFCALDTCLVAKSRNKPNNGTSRFARQTTISIRRSSACASGTNGWVPMR